MEYTHIYLIHYIIHTQLLEGKNSKIFNTIANKLTENILDIKINFKMLVRKKGKFYVSENPTFSLKSSHVSSFFIISQSHNDYPKHTTATRCFRY